MSEQAEITKFQWNRTVASGSLLKWIHPCNSEEDFWASGAAPAQRVMENLKDPGVGCVLDYGCGVGRVAKALQPLLADPKRQLYCYDTAPLMLDQLESMEFAANLNVVRDLRYSPQFDLIFSYAVFIHHTYADGCEIIQQLADKLVPGGCLALQIPVYDVRKEPKDWVDVGVWTEQDLKLAALHSDLILEYWHINRGEFSYNSIGKSHDRLQILRKKR